MCKDSYLGITIGRNSELLDSIYSIEFYTDLRFTDEVFEEGECWDYYEKEIKVFSSKLAEASAFKLYLSE